jgi:DUF2934 family protein
MDIITSIPVRTFQSESISSLLQDVHERVSRRAYQNFETRGCADGHALDDWLEAERELIIKPIPNVHVGPEDIIVEMILPEINLPNLSVHLAPRQLVISSGVEDNGLQVCQVIDLPLEISLDGVDAEQFSNMLRITTALA